MQNKPTISEIIILASGAVAVLFSFFPWIDLGSDQTKNAWSTDLGLLPLALYVALIGLAMAGQIALTKFANVNLPENVVGFTWKQIHLALSAFAVLLMLGWLMADFFGADKGIGLWLSLLAAIGLLVGAILMQREPEVAGPRPGSAPPTPF
ncbi:MAG: hypothetical protein ACRD0U_04210 [Acidimicrobiales bacterium]